MAQLVWRHLVRKTDFPLPSSSPFPSSLPSLQTTKPVLSCAAAPLQHASVSERLAAGNLTLTG